ncbi:MAG: response regulator transcription factor [Pseudolabrys sp.]|nr:response regulator transcription factor [Pseudolabrys sp.]MBV9954546.1 response regulator transcription factor [Pseudolabrys sp.]
MAGVRTALYDFWLERAARTLQRHGFWLRLFEKSRRWKGLRGSAGGVKTNTRLGYVVVQQTAKFHLVIADDHPLFRGAMREAVAGLYTEAKVDEAGSFDAVAELLERDSDVDLILLDLAMPGARGFSGLIYLRAQYPGVPVIVVSANDEPTAIRRCMEVGASGFIPKTLGVETMRVAISNVLKGGIWTPPDIDLHAGAANDTTELMTRMSTLTPQQVRVLMMLSEGLLNKQIAFQLGVSEATVKAHVSAILQKLGVESRTQAVIAAAKIEAGQWPQNAAADN